jgi:hypothetical protein
VVKKSQHRLEILEAGSLAVGDAWVEHVRQDLRVDSRRVVGGWPGTLREARARTYAHFSSASAARCYGVLTTNELELAARAAYGRARHQWLEQARR